MRARGAAQNGAMHAWLSTVRRSLFVPAVVPVLVMTGMGAWIANELARVALGAGEGFLAEARHGSMLFAGIVMLSLAEPLELGRDARSGLLLLRAARGGSFALVPRALGLLVACVPAVLVAGLAGGGLPSAGLDLALELALLTAGGMALGARFDRARLVPALWCLVLAGHLRPWLAEHPVGGWVAWVLPRLGDTAGAWGALHTLLWCAGALVLASHGLTRAVDRG